uniref:receptor protein-tyrosine kinase n=1 Tax=Salmo trutta TaxID=8032 RepID=A0A673W8Z8_SALTR
MHESNLGTIFTECQFNIQINGCPLNQVFQFVKSPANVTSSLGHSPLRLSPSLFMSHILGLTCLFSVTVICLSVIRIDHVKLSDIGRYRCMATVGRKDLMSQEGVIQLEGIPNFAVEPHDVTVVANVSLSLQCMAHGPPEPVRIIWLQNGGPLNTLQDPVSHSPSTLNITGLNHTSSFSCEAHNSKGVATSASGTVTVVPSQAHEVQAVEVTISSLLISWEPGFGGVYPVSVCSIQAAPSGPDRTALLNHLIHNQNVNVVPPARHLIPDLEPYSSYDVRVACRSSQGASPWTPWVTLRTSEGVPEAAPDNVSGLFNGTEVIVSWTKPPGRLNGQILGYRVEYRTPNKSKVTHVTVVKVNICCRHSLSLSPPHTPSLLFYFPIFNVLRIPVSVLVISDELKQKLQDVMVDRHKLTLGKTLGEGEFGSVMEGLLVHEETVLKVAVKTMKISICTRTEMEDFLREAACMKEFDHPNVMRLLGVCLQTVERGGYPSPVVILPCMKHGDLHSFLLYSRLGDSPLSLPSQMLVKFMTDIARGMEYLSNKRFIHRDLAARNCMLNENMTVCVADFGLSKKIYNGDYYRQGRISKMPVKWIAIESLADRVYTTKSDVWSFGVTMWEIATRGQTPYPGVENSEIYDYLRQGNRLKQPPSCLDTIYSLMFSCWLLSPKDRPGFPSLRCDLEKALEEMPEQEEADDLLYVNMEEPSGSLSGAVGGWEPFGLTHPSYQKNMGPLETAQVHRHHADRYVLCPQREAQPYLNDSIDSLSWMASSKLHQTVSASKPLFNKPMNKPINKPVFFWF